MTTNRHDAADGPEAMVRAVEEAYDRAWCDGDLDALVACLRPDAVVVNPRGQVAVGHVEIRDALAGFLAGEAHGSRHASTLDRIMFLKPDVAVVDGHAVISLAGSGTALEHPFTDVLVRDAAGSWAIAHVRAYQFAPAEPPTET